MHGRFLEVTAFAFSIYCVLKMWTAAKYRLARCPPSQPAEAQQTEPLTQSKQSRVGPPQVCVGHFAALISRLDDAQVYPGSAVQAGGRYCHAGAAHHLEAAPTADGQHSNAQPGIAHVVVVLTPLATRILHRTAPLHHARHLCQCGIQNGGPLSCTAL